MASPNVSSSRELPKAGLWPWFGLFAVLFLVGTEVMAFLTSVPDRDMGHLQKIMYVHVPAAWMTMLCFFVVLIYSVKFLWKKDENDDLLAAAAAEVGACFNALTLVLGMLWGKPTWGVWWTWDARLTSTLVLFLIFVRHHRTDIYTTGTLIAPRIPTAALHWPRRYDHRS